MDKLKIIGKSTLTGDINIPGSKNAALPIMVASLLSKNGLLLNNIPELQDIDSMKLLLKSFGIKIEKRKKKIFLNSSNIMNNVADYDLVRKMRASILVLGPLLARFKNAKISLPGGCSIGSRPIDIHLEGLKKFGIMISIEKGFVKAKVKNVILGANILLPFPSVGATENLMMIATLAKGETKITNASKEPEVVDLAKCLNQMGAKIKGAGTKKIIIQGVNNLFETEYSIMSDRIVAGTYMIAAIMLKSEFVINNIDPNFLRIPIKVLQKMGANLEIDDRYIKVLPSGNLKGCGIETLPYPGFPTDLQAQMMALMSLSKGNSRIKENIFENRFMHVPELNRLGAKITVIKDTAYIKGGQKFKGAQVMASDLRASVSLVLAGLCAEGNSVINRVYHLDRGYEKIEKTLGKCGPKIIRLK